MASVDEILEPSVPAVEKALMGIEDALAAMGLRTPSSRMVFGIVSGSAVSWVMKPASMFTKDGKPRPWVLLDNSKDATPFPFYGPGLALGVLFGVFI